MSYQTKPFYKENLILIIKKIMAFMCKIFYPLEKIHKFGLMKNDF